MSGIVGTQPQVRALRELSEKVMDPWKSHMETFLETHLVSKITEMVVYKIFTRNMDGSLKLVPHHAQSMKIAHNTTTKVAGEETLIPKEKLVHNVLGCMFKHLERSCSLMQDAIVQVEQRVLIQAYCGDECIGKFETIDMLKPV
jgi:hypothetical protein